MTVRRLPRCLLLFSCVAPSSAQAQPPAPVPSIEILPVGRDELAAMRERVAEVRRTLGDRAGIPETPDKYQRVPKQARWLTAAEVQSGFAKSNTQLEERRWWKPNLDPRLYRKGGELEAMESR